jgi:hypothetical protein
VGEWFAIHGTGLSTRLLYLAILAKEGPRAWTAVRLLHRQLYIGPFHTLAVDFQCTELPHILDFGCKNTSAEWLTTVAYQGPDKNPNVTSCGYYMQLPNGGLPQLMSGYEILADGTIGEVMSTRFFSLSDIWTNQLFFNGSISYPEVRHLILDFVLASTPGGFDGATQNNTPTVTECELHWVVKKLRSVVTNGRLLGDTLETLEFPSDINTTWDPSDSDVYRVNFSMTLQDPHSLTGETSVYGMSNITARQVWQAWAVIAPSTFNRPSATNPVKSRPVMKLTWLYDTHI